MTRMKLPPPQPVVVVYRVRATGLEETVIFREMSLGTLRCKKGGGMFMIP